MQAFTKLTAPLGALLLLFLGSAAYGQNATLQIIHNAPDPAAATVDVYAGDVLLLDDFAFRTATEFMEVPAGELTVGVAPGNSASAADAIATFPVTLEADASYIAVAQGVLDPSQFAANPDGVDIGFTLNIFPGRTTSSVPNLVDVAVVHGATDAPSVNAFVPEIQTTIVDSLTYGDVEPYFPASALPFTLEISPTADPETIVAALATDLTGLENTALVALASGFLDPSANQDGPGFAVLIVLPDGTAFTLPPPPITLREVNMIPEEDLETLINGGANLTNEEATEAVQVPFNNETIRFVAVVLTNPLNSGLSSFNDARGGPSRIHVFVRDTAAATQGPEGMGMQIVDGAYEQNGTLELSKGDVIDVVGQVSYFEKTIQVTPESIQVLGSYTDFGFDDSLLEPVPVTTADINQQVAEGQFQANWENFSALNNQYVVLDNATVLTRTTGGRPDWNVTTDGGETAVWMYDTSLRYRNDRDTYPDNYNVLDDEFVPPPPGSVVRLQGFVVQQGDDPANVSVPATSLFSLVPFEDEDLEILEAPPLLSNLSSLDALPGADPVDVSVDVTVDPARALDSVTLQYVTSSDPTDTLSVDMTNSSGITYTAQIPAVEDGDFVKYFVVASDDAGGSTTSDTVTYRVLLGGIQSISDIQLTFDGGPDTSPFAGLTTDVDITAIVQSTPDSSGFLVLQDDADLAPWSGIVVEPPAGVSLAPGDTVRITNATVAEINGPFFDSDGDVTSLSGVTLEKLGSGAPLGYKVVTTDLLQDDLVAEAHEGMMLRFESVVITDGDAGFGEWAFSSGGEEDALLADNASDALPEEDNHGLVRTREIIAFLQGVWSHSFGDYKLLPETIADIGEVTGVGNEAIGDGIPSRFTLAQNYPNPFNPVTTIRYNIGTPSQVTLDVFDLMGRRVATLVDTHLATGEYQATFSANDLASGMYVYRLTAGTEVITRKMILQK